MLNPEAILTRLAMLSMGICLLQGVIKGEDSPRQKQS